jgi:hypothetical protein
MSGNHIFESCVLKLNGTAGSIVGFGSDAITKLINTTMTFSSASDTFRCDSNQWTMLGGSLSGTAPTSFVYRGLYAKRFFGVDLSLLGSGKNLVDVTNMTGKSLVSFENCKLGSSVTVATGTFSNAGGNGSVEIRLVNCDSADTNYRYHKQNYHGTITQESTIVRTGGASDGTTPISRKMVSTANTKIYSPLVMDDIVFWNETTGSSQTATIEVVTDNVTLTDAECWLEVEYLGTSGFPISSLVNDRVTDDVFGTPANQTTSSETWTTTGLTTPVKQKLAVAFTAQEKGYVRIRVMLAKASTTVYVCPQVDGLGTSTRQAQVGPVYSMSGSEGGGGGSVFGSPVIRAA